MKKLSVFFKLLTMLITKPIFTLDSLRNRRFEKNKKIETHIFVKENELGIPLVKMPYHYASSGNWYLKRLLNKLIITTKDSIIDLGCGKGGALIYFSMYSFHRIAGIEFSEKLFTIAKSNIEKLSNKNIDVYYGDAGSFNDFDGFNYVYMYNPFGGETMQQVINKICQSAQKKPRQICIIYKNPTCHSIIEKSGVFIKVAEYKTERSFKFYIYHNI